MENFFTIPDKEKNYQSYMVYVLALMWSVVIVAIVSVGFCYFPHLWLRWASFIATAIFIAVFNIVLNRYGYTRLASWTLTVMLWLFLTIPCYTAGGILAPGILSQMSVILTAGFLLGWRGGLAIGLLTLGTDFWFAYLEVHSELPKPVVVHNPITRWIGAIIPFGTILALQYYATNHLRTGMVALQREIERREAADDKTRQNERLLKKITSQVPGNTYMFEIEANGNNKILFMSRGTDIYNHAYNFEQLSKTPEILREVVHPDDRVKFNDAMKEAYNTQSALSLQYRTLIDGTTRWRWLQAVPEKEKDGGVLWYGASNDITQLVEYIASIEQIIFDISHVIRRPVTSMLGMSKLIIEDELSAKEIKEISRKLYVISEQMDQFIHKLNHDYQQKRQSTKHNIDISSVIDKRNSLFK